MIFHCPEVLFQETIEEMPQNDRPNVMSEERDRYD